MQRLIPLVTFLACAADAASISITGFVSLVPRAMPSARRLRSTRLRAESQPSSQEPMTWEEKLEQLLKFDTPISQRQLLLRDLVQEAPEIRDEIRDTLVNAVPRREDVESLRRQVVEDILPAARSEGPEVASRLLSSLPALAQRAVTMGPSMLTQVQKEGGLPIATLIKEGRSAFQRTPEGLETPMYTLLYKVDEFEVRQYPEYAICTVRMDTEKDDRYTTDLLATGQAFRQLAAYLFGENRPKPMAQVTLGEAEPPAADKGVAMAMTTPVIIDKSVPKGATMSFILPSDYTLDTAPLPRDIDIDIEKAGGDVLAVRDFSGFATEGEISRQLDKLRDAIALEGKWEVVDESSDAFKVFQYNPPQTLPWLRKNEVAVRVRRKGTGGGEGAGGEVEEPIQEGDEDFDPPSDSA
ncbi:unnamed protein product [Vitrella brassicaformis CCMP3155]|uniref:SOUL heme-binding protein n=1 Tax=Vitrella brassicaformis (strain CCMP3155) TaxID=1169540 RepID=A0A0G4G1P9_VITBC|nr:unnamed protein product [Vitrella brassicaformis CCMP3155]|mmetsp:Transcript_40661/g.115895  ORF Transcript_40661/g.115895 Transcript_40661/m.115895 type:complete len:411 (-) Transcript_40661:586-1818(-)|eukprot:CEM21977.1 unnamed protein product [Vitrella brassicaformis CCMP3155]